MSRLPQAAACVDRMFRGEASRDRSVQQPASFEFVINLKTAKALGIEVPAALLATADEVVEQGFCSALTPTRPLQSAIVAPLP